MKLKIPYRINWAGAYLDCIGESVITSTIDKYLTFKCKKRKDNIVSVYSKEFNEKCVTDLHYHALEYKHWSQYVKGCIACFIKNNFKLKFGCDIVVYNDLPSGIGVSSSAAFIIGIIKCLAWINKINVTDDFIADYAYWVEHTYLDIPCGKMDFKAVLHEPGIWKIDTSSFSLDKDVLLQKNKYVGLLLYKKQHSHLTDDKFFELVKDVEKAKANIYIDFEKTIIQGITYEAEKNNLNNDFLGMFINQSYLNMTVNLFKKQCSINTTDGVYGDKLLGSGLKESHFLLIDKNKIKSIIKKYNKDYNITKCII